jgi:hypothetical protein
VSATDRKVRSKLFHAYADRFAACWEPDLVAELGLDGAVMLTVSRLANDPAVRRAEDAIGYAISPADRVAYRREQVRRFIRDADARPA